MLHLTRPKPGVNAPVTPAEPEPLTPKGNRSHEPKPFEGLTQKPYCALCAPATDARPPATLVRPKPMPLTKRRPREIDTSMHFCPHTKTVLQWLARATEQLRAFSAYFLCDLHLE
jgi:hypothetical protein